MKKILLTPVGLIISGFILTASTIIQADEYYRPVSESENTVFEECGACHIAYSPEMLPAASWEKIISSLSNHFGEDASISPQDEIKIRNFYVKYAADSGWFGNRFTRGYDPRQPPLRITETPYWIMEHHEIAKSDWNHPEIKSKSNCLACHRYAQQGGYDDD